MAGPGSPGTIAAQATSKEDRGLQEEHTEEAGNGTERLPGAFDHVKEPEAVVECLGMILENNRENQQGGFP